MHISTQHNDPKEVEFYDVAMCLVVGIHGIVQKINKGGKARLGSQLKKNKIKVKAPQSLNYT